MAKPILTEYQDKQKFETEKKLDAYCYGYRVQKQEWTGPGWYFIFKYTQRCPRDCCYDDVIWAIDAAEYRKLLVEQGKEIAGRLSEIRSLK